MRILKQNTLNYHSFINSLPIVDRKELANDKQSYQTTILLNSSENLERLFSLDNLLNFSESILSLKNSSEVLKKFNNQVNRLNCFYQPEIFIVNEKSANLISLNSNCDLLIVDAIKKLMNNGIIDWVAEKKEPQIIDNQLHSNYKNCLLIPIIYQSKFKAILFTFTNLTPSYVKCKAINYLKTLFYLTFQRIQNDLFKSELNNIYFHIHTLQSKLENDFKLATLGELTYRSLEQISSPIQVILTYTDLIKQEMQGKQDENLDIIKQKIYDIKNILERLVKFINNNNSNVKISVCSLNEHIWEFYKLIEPAILAENCEIVFDLDEDIPTILSNSNFLNQILINAFSLINPLAEKNSGIIFQTRYSKQNVILRMIFTRSIDLENMKEYQTGINILKALMGKHEGELIIDSKKSGGTKLVFTFPLIRKVRAW